MKLRPLAIGGIDGYACNLVNMFAEAYQKKIGESAPFLTFSVQTEAAIKEFKDQLAAYRESLKARNQADEPRIVLFTSAFSPNGLEGLNYLDPISRTLQMILPGSQAIILIVLFPPMSADDTAKTDSFKFFLRLEGIAGELPFLNLIFVNQVSSEIFRNCDAETLMHDALFELIYRQILDHELEQPIQGIGTRAIENRDISAGMKCCYSTSGVYRLHYLQNECIQYLESRLQNEIFLEGFLNVESVKKDPDTLERIQTRADDFVARLIETAQSEIPQVNLISESESGAPEEFDALKAQVAVIQEQIGSITERVSATTKSVLAKKEETVGQEIMDFLSTSPGYFAGVKLYSEMLEGKRYAKGKAADAQVPSGRRLFQNTFCLGPLSQSIEDFCRPYFQRYQIELSNDLAEPRDARWVLSALNEASKRILEVPEEWSVQAHFLHQSLESLVSNLASDEINLDLVKRTIDDLMSKFFKVVKEVYDQINQNREQHQAAEDEIDALENDMSFLAKSLTKRKEYRLKKQELVDKIGKLDRKCEALLQKVVELRQFFIKMINSVIFPHIGRAFVNQLVWEAIGNSVKHLNSYLTEIKSFLEDRWRLASSFTESRTATAATVLNQERLNTLYQMILNNKKPANYVQQVFEYIPQNLPDEEKKKLSYYDCRNLTDHYRGGAQTLLDRLKHFSLQQALPVSKMNLLDIIELEGKDRAHQYLKHTLDNLEKFLDFSPGLIPLVQQDKRMYKMLVVRSDKQINNRLASDYQHLFSSETQFIENDDANLIDFTSLIFGFPAFVIHGLSECRELFFKKTPNDSADLWPVSADT